MISMTSLWSEAATRSLTRLMAATEHTCAMHAAEPVSAAYRYRFLVDDRIVCHGITTDLCRREREHRRRWPGGHIEQVGGTTSHREAWDWDQQQSAVDKSALTG